MFYFESTREKIFQGKIERQFKPYIDQNLQLQIPGTDHQTSLNNSHNPIYAHYIGSHSPQEVNEVEIYQAMEDAEHSYLAWSQMQQKLKKMIDSIKARREVT